jgi:hypothetical protein
MNTHSLRLLAWHDATVRVENRRIIQKILLSSVTVFFHCRRKAGRTYPASLIARGCSLCRDGWFHALQAGEPWKEVKPGKLFKGSNCMKPNSKFSYLSASQYVALMGNSSDFGERLQKE